MEEKKDAFPYEDILSLSRPVSCRHLPMPRKKRAAQFMPFQALNGLAEKIRQTEQESFEHMEHDVIEIIDGERFRNLDK